jgi:16S rRNA C967 or C1407 C5-methylase (RsmB/RsmF family)
MDYRTEVAKKSTDPKPTSQKKVKKSEFWERMQLLLGNEAELNALREAFNRFQHKAPKALRPNPLRKSSVELLKKNLPGIDWSSSLPWSPTTFRISENTNISEISEHPLIGSGSAYIQEPSAL